jgi:nickel transport protein
VPHGRQQGKGWASRALARGRNDAIFSHMTRRVFLPAVTLIALVLLITSPSVAFDLFATHEVTAQFATPDGKPMANAEVQVFAPGGPKTPVLSGRTDANGKFVFDADRDGFWSAEARSADQVARIMIKVGGETQPQSRISPFLVIGLLAILLAVAIWYRLLRLRRHRTRS